MGKFLDELDLRKQDDLTDFVTRLWEIGKDAKREREARWAKHLRHFDGDQWAYFDPEKSVISHYSPSEGDPHRVRLCLSLLPMYITHMIARMAGGKITWRADPMTTDQADIDRSDHVNRTLKHLAERLRLQAKRAEAMMWLGICHDVFLQSTWNDDAGVPLRLELGDFANADGPVDMAELGKRLKLSTEQQELFVTDGGIDTRTGDNHLALIDSFRVIPDLDTGSDEDLRYMLVTGRRTMDYLLERHPGKKEKLLQLAQSGEDFSFGFDVYTRIDMAGVEDVTSRVYQWFRRKFWPERKSGRDDLTRSYIVHELWHVPTKRYPDGLHAVVVGDIALTVGENRYRRIPLVHLQELPMPNDYWGTGAFTQADEIQVAINGIASKSMEILSRTAAPKVYARKGSGFEEDLWTNDSGDVQFLEEPNRDIRVVEPPQLPIAFRWLMELYVDSLQRITGMHDVSTGRPSRNAPSGISISLLQQAEQIRFSPIFDRHEVAFADVAAHQLAIAADNWTTRRHLSIAGENGERQFYTLAGRDLSGADAGRGAVLDFDVRVSIERPRLREMVMEEIKFLLGAGILRPDNPLHQRLILQRMRYVSAHDEGYEDSQHRSKAALENQKLARVEKVVPAWGDDDDSHIEVHRAWTITEDYARVRTNSPVLDAARDWTLLDERMMQHELLHLRQKAAKLIQPVTVTKQVEQELMASAGFQKVAAGQQPGGNGASSAPAPTQRPLTQSPTGGMGR